MIHQTVVDIFPTFTKPLEWDVLWPYQDVKGLVTVGYGCLIEPVGLALPINWIGDPSIEDVRKEWIKVNALPKALHFKQYERACTLRVTEETSVALLDHRLQDFAAHMIAKYVPDFPEWPADAQLACLAQAWACGPDFFAEFKNMLAFCRKRDWLNAAKCQKIRTDGNAGIIPRNAAIQLCLANALELDGPDGYATPALYWPKPVTDITGNMSDDAYPLSYLAERAMLRAYERFDIHDDGITGHTHGAAA